MNQILAMQFSGDEIWRTDARKEGHHDTHSEDSSEALLAEGVILILSILLPAT